MCAPAPRRPHAFIGRAAAALVALGCAGAGFWLASRHPLAPWVAPVLFALAAIAFGRWPMAWLTALPALLPLLGLAPYTGWITFEEWDLLVLAIAAGGYLHCAAVPARPQNRASSTHLSLATTLVVLLYAAALLVSTFRGIADAGGFEFGLFQGYREPMNSLRLAKSLFAALFLYPLWSAAQQSDPARSTRRLTDGLVLGLLGTAAAATWERSAFTGLLNFSTDYRTTALFWEMHVGGAALDGMLSLTFAFVVRELLVHPSRGRLVFLAPIVPIAAYASLTTFSRAVYLSVPASVAVMFVVQAWQAPSSRPAGPQQWLPAVLPAAMLVAGFAWAASAMFPTSGYRGLIALLAVASLLPALPVTLREQPRTVWLQGLASGLAFTALALAASLLIPKGAYAAFGIAALGTMALWLLPPQRGLSRNRQALVLGGFLSMVAGTALVARHWGGHAALVATLPVLAATLVLLAAALALPAAPWPSARRWQAGTAGCMLLAAGVVAAFGGGAYMSDRFATSSSDFSGRIEHWKRGLSLLRDPYDLAFGRGVGRFVERFALSVPADQTPGDYRLLNERDNRLVTMVAGTHVLGWGELLRLSQRIAAPVGPTTVRLDVRADQAAIVHFDICLKNLLYVGECLVKQARLPAKPGQWQTVQVRFDGAQLVPGPWYAHRPVVFSVASEVAAARVDIDNLVVAGIDGHNLLANGDFEQELARWFMTSDRHHMPWHMKNMAAHVVFDQGLVGLGLLGLLVLGALLRVSFGSARAHPLAPGVAGGLAGFLIVGLFDSLLDVPRVSFLFYFLVLLGLSLRPPTVQPAQTVAPAHSSGPAAASRPQA